MSRNVVSVAVAFALLVGGAMLASESVKAGHGCGGGLFGHHRGNNCGGGLFSHHRGNNCGGGLFSHHRGNNCGGVVERGCGGGLFSRLHARKAATCCAPEPVCCTPEPVCCTPEPTCCAPQPTCCEAAPVAQGCCGEQVVYGDSVVGGEHQAVEGQQVEQQGEASAEAASASDDVPPAPQADGASDAPPAPQPE